MVMANRNSKPNVSSRGKAVGVDRNGVRGLQLELYMYCASLTVDFGFPSEGMTHGNVSFNDNGTMTSIPLHPLTWLPELSNGTEEDLLILPNIALLVSASFQYRTTFKYSLNAYLCLQ